MRIPAPNYTQTPNDLFDEWIPHLNESELKVLLVIIRKTFGWHKVRDRISLSQLERFTGLSAPSVLGAIKSLVSKGVIHKETIGEKGVQQTFYELVIEDSNNSYPLSNLPPQDSLPPKIVGGGPPKILGDTKETLSTKEKQQQGAAPPAAAVPSKDKFFKVLETVAIPEKDKMEITQSYKKSIIEDAVSWAIQQMNTVGLKKSLAAAIKFACSRALRPEPEPASIAAENKEWAKQFDKKNNNSILVEALSKQIEFIYLGCQKQPEVIDYEDKSFREKVIKLMQKFSL